MRHGSSSPGEWDGGQIRGPVGGVERLGSDLKQSLEGGVAPIGFISNIAKHELC